MELDRRYGQAPAESDWLRRIDEGLQSYLALPDNWDSYGAGPVEQGVIRQARAFSELMAENGFSRPEVGPMSSGGIGFEWQGRDCYLTVGIEPNASIDFSYEGANGREIEGSADDLFRVLGSLPTL